MKNPMEDITAICINWCTARRTLGAVESFKREYPEIPLLIIDDDSQESMRGEFGSAYRQDAYQEERIWDPDTEKLKHIPGTTYLQVPPHTLHPHSHGWAMDFAARHIDTTWMFMFHSDWRCFKRGILENMTKDLAEDICAVGDKKTRHPELENVNDITAIYNLPAGREHNLSFQAILEYPDKTIEYYPGTEGKKGATMYENGAFYVGKLHQLGYKIIFLPKPWDDPYGWHMRWDEGEEERWQKYF